MLTLSVLRKLRSIYGSPQFKMETRAFILFMTMFVPCFTVFFVVCAWLFELDRTSVIYIAFSAVVVSNVLAYFLNKRLLSRSNRQ